ncbi:hypothetical protein M514_00181 [Trichuris suis]|uniref:Uncharacterized protein n=1 Tax=Trichuris suis TaxID=68888 RepID=A0A085NUA6_9BILA|nr:hypothetical protein M513_00181 [Trichuris suis]KFD73052.1 hypothetical protein M514_00181 [Trichuris suis]KHJ46145.1 hypothetical protein D918_03809 [Trichuris suis]
MAAQCFATAASVQLVSSSPYPLKITCEKFLRSSEVHSGCNHAELPRSAANNHRCVRTSDLKTMKLNLPGIETTGTSETVIPK